MPVSYTHLNTLLSFTYSCKEVGGNRLKTVYKCEKQINAEIFFSKGKIIFTAAAEQADNLSWQELEQQKRDDRDHKT